MVHNKKEDTHYFYGPIVLSRNIITFLLHFHIRKGENCISFIFTFN